MSTEIEKANEVRAAAVTIATATLAAQEVRITESVGPVRWFIKSDGTRELQFAQHWRSQNACGVDWVAVPEYKEE